MIERSRKTILTGISRNVLLLGLVSFFTDLSSQMVFPLIPLFLTSVLGAGAWVVGLVEGGAETTSSLLKVVSGYWSDRIRKRKPFVIFGYSLSSFTKPLFAFANFWGFVLFLRIVERIGKGMRTAPRDAIVAESTKEKFRGRAYGFHRTMDGIGSVLGALVASLLLSICSFREIFLYALVPGILVVVATLFIRERKTAVIGEAGAATIRLNVGKLSWNMRMFVVAASLFSFGHFGYAFLLLKAKNIGLDDPHTILLYVLFYFVYTLCSLPFGILSDRIGRRPILVLGYALFAITSIGLIFSAEVNSLALCFVSYGVFFAMIDGVQRAFVVDLAPAELKATALGVFHTAVGLVALPGGIIAGLLWDRWGSEATFLFGSLLAIVAIVFLMFVKEQRFHKSGG